MKQYRNAKVDDNDTLSEDPSLSHDTNEIAQRFWIKVVEDYKDWDAVLLGFALNSGLKLFLCWAGRSSPGSTNMRRIRLAWKGIARSTRWIFTFV